MKLQKEQIIKVVKEFKVKGKNQKVGTCYKVWMESDNKSAHMLVKLTKSGKETSVTNINNILALHETSISELIEAKAIELI